MTGMHTTPTAPRGRCRPHRRWLGGLLALALSAGLCVGGHTEEEWPLAPEFTSALPQDWLNSEPLKIADLRGRVALLMVWAYSCRNCYLSFPWLLKTEERLAPELAIIGIHAPEFNHERDPRNVKRKLAKFGIKHPVLIDNEFKYWRRLGNRYWPSFYLIDKSGRQRAAYIGQTDLGSARAKAMTASIERLLAEPGPAQEPAAED